MNGIFPATFEVSTSVVLPHVTNFLLENLASYARQLYCRLADHLTYGDETTFYQAGVSLGRVDAVCTLMSGVALSTADDAAPGITLIFFEIGTAIGLLRDNLVPAKMLPAEAKLLKHNMGLALAHLCIGVNTFRARRNLKPLTTLESEIADAYESCPHSNSPDFEESVHLILERHFK